MDPEVILLDEPTSALDPTMVGEVQAVIRELSKTGKTMMIGYFNTIYDKNQQCATKKALCSVERNAFLLSLTLRIRWRSLRGVIYQA